MRITNKFTLDTNIRNYQSGSKSIYDLQARFNSGLKIQNSFEDSAAYNDATRLDYELALLEQVKSISTRAKEFTSNSDDALKGFVSLLTRFKTKLIQAANAGVQNPTSRQALANDLESFRRELMNIANTSINGQYLFSGTALNTKPIDSNGNYHGNSDIMKALIGANQFFPHNIDGESLFRGRDNDYHKVTTTNSSLTNHRKYLIDPDKQVYSKPEDKIYDLIGGNYRSQKNQAAIGKMDHERDFTPDKVQNLPQTTFFMQGKKADGESFAAKFSLSADSSVQKILDKVGEALGNTETNKVVEVSLNDSGQIEVKDLKSGNILNEFSLFGLTAVSGAPGETPLNSAQIEALRDQNQINQAVKDGKVYMTEFIKSSGFKDTLGKESGAQDYDKLRFSKKDNVLSSNLSQVQRDSGEYATNSTKLVDVAGVNLTDSKGNRLKDANGEFIKPDLTKSYDKNGNSVPSDKNITMRVKSRDGNNYQAKIEFVGQGADKRPTLTISQVDNAGNVGAQIYKGNIYKGQWDPTQTGKKTDGVKVGANDLTYQNLSDIAKVLAAGDFGSAGLNGVNENINSTNPADTTAAYERFNNALKRADRYVDAGLDHKGRMTLKDKDASVTKMEFAMYEDRGGNDYPPNVGLNNAANNGIFSFNANSAIPIDEPSVDIFKDLEDMIQAVRDGTYRADKDAVNSRTTGIQGAIRRIDHLLDHIDKKEAIAGTYTNTFTSTIQRTIMLATNVNSVKSDVIDADLGKTSMEYYHRIMSMQGSLQATAKISQLSLLNYI